MKLWPLAAVALALLAGCQQETRPQVLHRGTAAEPPTLDPTLGAGTLASPLISDMVQSLLSRDQQGRPAPGSAERWEVSEDGRTYTFHLRENLRWSDGTPLTADDFVYSWRRLMDPKTASRLVGVYFVIENARAVFLGRKPPGELGVSAADPRTVVFRLEHRTPYFIDLVSNMQAFPVPRHVIEEHGKQWTRAGTMVTNGAYMLAERVPQSYIKLVKNPYYHDADSVAIDEVYWHPTQDLATSLRRFRAGELDIVLNFPSDEQRYIEENNPEVMRITPALSSYFLVINTTRPPFDDVRIREALYLAIDREAITDKLLGTGVKPVYSFALADFENYDGITMPAAAMTQQERNERARALLAEAGYGPDKPLPVEVAYDTQEENRKIFVAIANMWRDVGVEAALTNVEFRMLNRLVRTRDIEVARWAYFASYNDPYAFLQLFLSNNPNNWPGWKNARYDELMRASNDAIDPGRRKEMLAEAERIFMADYPVIPVYQYVGRRLVSTRVRGWVDTPTGPTQTRFLSLATD